MNICLNMHICLQNSVIVRYTSVPYTQQKAFTARCVSYVKLCRKGDFRRVLHQALFSNQFYNSTNALIYMELELLSSMGDWRIRKITASWNQRRTFIEANTKLLKTTFFTFSRFNSDTVEKVSETASLSQSLGCRFMLLPTSDTSPDRGSGKS